MTKHLFGGTERAERGRKELTGSTAEVRHEAPGIIYMLIAAAGL